LRIDLADQADLCLINVAERKMLKQVVESKNSQLFFKQIGPRRAYSLQVFYRTG
jgi:hypothetical protein